MIDGFAGQETLYDDMAAGASCAPITDYRSYSNRQLDAVGGGLDCKRDVWFMYDM